MKVKIWKRKSHLHCQIVVKISFCSRWWLQKDSFLQIQQIYVCPIGAWTQHWSAVVLNLRRMTRKVSQLKISVSCCVMNIKHFKNRGFCMLINSNSCLVRAALTCRYREANKYFAKMLIWNPPENRGGKDLSV